MGLELVDANVGCRVRAFAEPVVHQNHRRVGCARRRERCKDGEQANSERGNSITGVGFFHLGAVPNFASPTGNGGSSISAAYPLAEMRRKRISAAPLTGNYLAGAIIGFGRALSAMRG